VKVAVFVLGLVLLAVGLIGALYGWIVASGLEATHAFTCTGAPPQPPPDFCAALLSSASTYRTLAFGMVALFLVGVVLSVAGAIMKELPSAPTMMMPPQPVPPPGALHTCKNCGRSMPSTDRFCPGGGTAQW
jgi:hypothetical protein